jgi:hypothetical protein
MHKNSIGGKLTEHRAFHHIPIYDCRVWFILTSDMAATRGRYDHLFGEYDASGSMGLVSVVGGRVAIFIEDKCLSHHLIAHEVFHAIHRVMEFVGNQISPTSQEPYAALCEYLTKLVYADLKRWGVRVK